MVVQSSLKGVGILFVSVFLINGVKAVTTNVALNKPVTSSSVYVCFWSDIANIVDGDVRQDAPTCECCAATQTQENPWITVDLGKEYWIENVVVYSRNDIPGNAEAYRFLDQSLSGLQLHFTNASVVQDDAFYTVEDSGWIDFVNVSVGEQLKSRYVTLLLKGETRLFPVCELEVHGSACKSGSYGVNCDQTCGHCYNGEPCDEVTGICTSCAAGYKEALCQTVCSEGTYGNNCTQECGHCINREPCGTKTGECQSCSPGFQGLDCKQACDPGSYGPDCSSNCGQCYGNAMCDTVTGACQQCMAGFKGLTCLSACDNGTFGINFRWACGPCYEKQPCNKVDGKCERCDPGYLGDICDRECISGSYGQDCSSLCGFCRRYEPCTHTTGLCSSGCAAGRQGETSCENNTFGTNCSQQCHCVDNKSCDLFTGDCEDGVCSEGFIGVGCQNINGSDVESNGKNEVMFIGVVSGLAFIILVLVVTGVCFLKRRKLEETSKGVTMTTGEHSYDDLEIQEKQL